MAAGAYLYFHRENTLGTSDGTGSADVTLPTKETPLSSTEDSIPQRAARTFDSYLNRLWRWVKPPPEVGEAESPPAVPSASAPPMTRGPSTRKAPVPKPRPNSERGVSQGSSEPLGGLHLQQDGTVGDSASGARADQSSASAQHLTNESLVRLARSGLSQETLLLMVKSQPGTYSLRPDDVIALKQAGVSEDVIAAMISRTYSHPVSVSAGTTSPPVAEVGVYYKNREAWVELVPERITWKAGSVLKSVATLGIARRERSGSIAGEHSPSSLQGPVDFLICLPEGELISAYQLLRLRQQAGNREFRLGSAESGSDSGASRRDSVKFGYRRIAPRSYVLTLAQLPEGEYGFLPAPNLSSDQAHGSSRIFTFRIVR